MFFRTIDIPTPPRPKPFQDKYLEALRAIASELNQIRMYLEKSEGIDMAKSKTKHRRGSGRPMGMTLADELARKRMIKQAVQKPQTMPLCRFGRIPLHKRRSGWQCVP